MKENIKKLIFVVLMWSLCVAIGSVISYAFNGDLSNAWIGALTIVAAFTLGDHYDRNYE